MKNYSTQINGLIYLFLASLCLSTIPVAVKIGLQQDNVSPFELVVFRAILASLMLWVYFLCFRRDRIRIDREGFLRCLQVAITNCTSMTCYFFALSYIEASLMIIIYVAALIPTVLLLLMLRGEFPSYLDLLRFLMALSGIYLFMGLMGSVSAIGIVLAIATALLYGTYITLIQWYLSSYDSSTVALYIITCMATLFGITYLALGYRWPTFSGATWGAVVWLAIVATALARILLFAGIRYAGSRQAALLSPFDTLLTVLLSIWLLGESLTLQQWIGTLLVIISVALGVKAKRPANQAVLPNTSTPKP